MKHLLTPEEQEQIQFALDDYATGLETDLEDKEGQLRRGGRSPEGYAAIEAEARALMSGAKKLGFIIEGTPASWTTP